MLAPSYRWRRSATIIAVPSAAIDPSSTATLPVRSQTSRATSPVRGVRRASHQPERSPDALVGDEAEEGQPLRWTR